MAIVFHQDDRCICIEVDQTEVTIQALINAIRDFEDNLEAMDNPSIANAYGKQDLGGGMKVGITLELINNWRIKFGDRAGPEYILCKISGGNLVAINDYDDEPIKPAAFVQVTLAQASSAVIIDLEAVKGSGFVEDVDSLKQISDKVKKLRNQLRIA